MKYFYVLVTADKYELPLYVADNYKDLAEVTGRSIACLQSVKSKNRRMKFNGEKCYIRKVARIDDKEEMGEIK